MPHWFSELQTNLRSKNNKSTGGGKTARKEVKIMDINTTWNEDELEAIEELNEIFNL